MSELARLLVSRHASVTADRLIAQSLPIPPLDFHELPPTKQAELARRARGSAPQEGSPRFFWQRRARPDLSR